METDFLIKLDKYLPQKKLKISSHEKPWINFELKYLDRRKKREYVKHGRSEKFLNLKRKYDKNLKKQQKDIWKTNSLNLKYLILAKHIQF